MLIERVIINAMLKPFGVNDKLLHGSMLLL